MTQPRSRLAPARRGFTLVELVVVIGIVIILFSLVLVGVNRATLFGSRTATGATLVALSTALEQYRSDHGDYPRFAVDSATPADPLNASGERGAQLLARALLGIAPAGNVVDNRQTGTSTFQDGHDGLGFRVQTRTGQLSRVYEPYVDPARFTLSATGGNFTPETTFVGGDGRPILYYPARQTRPNINLGENFVASTAHQFRQTSLYNHYDNRDRYPGNAGLADFRRLLGDANANGRIDDGETPATTGPFLLIAPSDDGDYARPVTNFR